MRVDKYRCDSHGEFYTSAVAYKEGIACIHETHKECPICGDASDYVRQTRTEVKNAETSRTS